MPWEAARLYLRHCEGIKAAMGPAGAQLTLLARARACVQRCEQNVETQALELRPVNARALGTKGHSSTYLAMGFANVRAGTQKRRAVFGYSPEH